jgi:heme exporter protein C
MKKALAWLLWLWISLVIAGAFKWAPLAQDFIGESSRILFFHVPMAWASFVGFMAAGVWSALYLMRGRQVRHDQGAHVAVILGLVFCVLATLTGAIWAKIMWGEYWNWDPRQLSIIMAMVFYMAYLALRSAVQDPQTARRLAAAYALLGLAVAPFLFFVLPRLSGFTLHPEPVINQTGKIEVEERMLTVLIAGAAGFTALFFWMHNLGRRLQGLVEEAATRPYTHADTASASRSGDSA